jgi:hypothetical protein
MRTKNNYLKALLKYNASWIRLSFLNPNKYMTKTDLIIHAIAYRKLTGINLYTLKGIDYVAN